jgi:hypothetical protein
MAARIAMMAMTTNNSIKVNPPARARVFEEDWLKDNSSQG